MAYRKTPAAARELGISYTNLIGLMRYGKLEPPERDSSGDYVWTDADMDRARRALELMHRRREKGSSGACRLVATSPLMLRPWSLYEIAPRPIGVG